MRIEKEKYMAEALALARECADLLSDFFKALRYGGFIQYSPFICVCQKVLPYGRAFFFSPVLSGRRCGRTAP